MNRRRVLYFLPGWIFIIVLIAACNPTELAAEPDLEIATITPSSTPTPTATPAPDYPAIYAAMLPVVSSQGVPEAAVYDPNKPGPHRVVILTASFDITDINQELPDVWPPSPGGEAYTDWNEKLPNGWSPSSVSETELVVLVHPEWSEWLDSQRYTFGSVTAYRFAADLELREARTGQTLSTTTITGSDPRPFPFSIPVTQDRIEGSHVSYASLETWLGPSVMTQGCWMPVSTLELDTGKISSAAFSPDGQTLALGSISGRVSLWQVSDGSLLHTLEGHTDMVNRVVFSPDGQILASSGWENDTTVRLWRVSDGSLLHTLVSDSYPLAFSPDGQVLALRTTNDSVQLWRVSEGYLLRTLEGIPGVLAFSPDGLILASGAMRESVQLRRFSDGTLLRTLEGGKITVKSIVFSPDGQILAGELGKALWLWRVSDGSLLRKMEGISGFVTFSPDWQTLASSSTDTSVQLWRVSDGALLRTLDGPALVYDMVFSPDGKTLAMVGNDGTLHLWQVQP